MFFKRIFQDVYDHGKIEVRADVHLARVGVVKVDIQQSGTVKIFQTSAIPVWEHVVRAWLQPQISDQCRFMYHTWCFRAFQKWTVQCYQHGPSNGLHCRMTENGVRAGLVFWINGIFRKDDNILTSTLSWVTISYKVLQTLGRDI